MKILLLSPYHGGSHQAWAEGYRANSRNIIQVLTLPARFWKWRMHGGAVSLARQFDRLDFTPDLILATDMLDLAGFLSLTRRRTAAIPTALYMHENQLTYPLPPEPDQGPMRRQHGERDLHYVFINYLSALVADAVFFNSDFHRQQFLSELPKYLNRFPDFNEATTVETIAAKSSTLPVGIDLQRFDDGDLTNQDVPPLIVWNQRWEYDKNPGAFLEVLYQVNEAGIPFRLALCGQNFRNQPQEFERALVKLQKNIIHAGFANEPRYKELLWQASLVISTAHHEFFGISILEAIYCHTIPFLPDRLSYPELLPQSCRSSLLYSSQQALLEKTVSFLSQPASLQGLLPVLATHVFRYDWRQVANQYDTAFYRLL